MEWVLAVLGVGCVFFAFQVIVDYIRYRRVIQPKIARLEEAKVQLRDKIEATKSGGWASLRISWTRSGTKWGNWSRNTWICSSKSTTSAPNSGRGRSGSGLEPLVGLKHCLQAFRLTAYLAIFRLC